MQEEQRQQISQQQQQQISQPPPTAPDDNASKENIDKVYDIEGLLAGGAAGLVIGLLISFDTIFAMQLGMFSVLIIGTRFKKGQK